jgi:hypothetical protein
VIYDYQHIIIPCWKHRNINKQFVFNLLIDLSSICIVSWILIAIYFTVIIERIMNNIDFFKSPNCVAHKQYEVLRMYYIEGVSAKLVAEHIG